MSVRSTCGVLVGSTILALSLTACGSNSGCQPTGPWGPPPALNFTLIAQQLGVSVDSVRTGSAGFADCRQPFLLSNMGSPELGTVVVEGIGDRCVVFGIGGDATPMSESASTVVALCPAPTTSA